MTPPVLNNDKRLFKLGGVIHFGGPEGDRTLDLTDANELKTLICIDFQTFPALSAGM